MLNVILESGKQKAKLRKRLEASAKNIKENLALYCAASNSPNNQELQSALMNNRTQEFPWTHEQILGNSVIIDKMFLILCYLLGNVQQED